MRVNEAKTHANSYIHVVGRERESPLLLQGKPLHGTAMPSVVQG